MTSVRILFAAAAATALLGACGGGGSDAGAPPPAAPVAITPANQEIVARAAVDGGLALTRSQVLQADGRAGIQSAQGEGTARAAAPTSARAAVLSLTRRALNLAVPDQRRVRADARVRPLAVTRVTEDCTVSGTLTVAFDDRDDSQTLTANDRMELGFSSCKEAEDELVNGTIVFTIANVTAATELRQEFTGSMSFQNVSMNFGDAASSIHGSVSVGFLSTSTLAQLNLTVGSSGLSATVTAPSYSDTVTYEPGLAIESVENLTIPASSTARINGSLSASTIGGLITLTTLQPVAQLHSDIYPYAGQIRVVGAASSALRITVLDNALVRIELDAGGDGVYEAATDLPWSTLAPE